MGVLAFREVNDTLRAMGLPIGLPIAICVGECRGDGDLDARYGIMSDEKLWFEGVNRVSKLD